MKSNSVIGLILMFLIVSASFSMIANGEGKKDIKNRKLKKEFLVTPTQSLMNINNATMWVTEEGFHDWIVASGWNGAFPNGTSVGSIFSEGIVWGGKFMMAHHPMCESMVTHMVLVVYPLYVYTE